MGNPSFVHEHLAAWLEPATTSLASSQVETYTSAIDSVAQELTPNNAFLLTRLAHRIPDAASTAWFSGSIRALDPAFVADGKEELVSRLAAAAAARAVVGADCEQRLLVALLIQSAGFLGLVSGVPELEALADEAVLDGARAARSRYSVSAGLVKTIETILSTPTNADGTPATPDQISQTALLAIAGAVDSITEQLADRLRLVDEEYNALWWSYTSISTGLKAPWESVHPIERRVVHASTELNALLTEVPGPPTTRNVLSAALAGEATTSITLAALAESVVSEGIPFDVNREDTLLPITSCVFNVRKLRSDEERTWKKVVGAALGIDADLAVTSVDAGCQLIREHEIGALL